MIEIGTLRRWPAVPGATDAAFEMRFLKESDLPQIMALQEIIIGRLSQKDLLEAFSRPFMLRHIADQGFIIGIFVQDRLIAFRNVYFPDVNDREWNLGYDIGLESADALKQVANLQMICVHPDFRGNSLGWRMNVRAIARIRQLQRYTHLCATVSPYNYWNIKILLRSGFTIRQLTRKYNGKLRYIVYQDLAQPFVVVGGRETKDESVAVRLTNIERQHELIRQGFIGVQLRAINGFRPKRRSDYADGFEVLFSLSCRPDVGHRTFHTTHLPITNP